MGFRFSHNFSPGKYRRERRLDGTRAADAGGPDSPIQTRAPLASMRAGRRDRRVYDGRDYPTDERARMNILVLPPVNDSHKATLEAAAPEASITYSSPR